MGRKLLAGLAFVLFPVLLHSQAVSPVTPKNASAAVGGFFSYGQTDYGQNHAMGPGIYGDFNYHLWRNFSIGAEGEARFLDYHLVSGVSEQNFLIGPRLSYLTRRRFVPYVKVLAGVSRFHYPTFISTQSYTYTTYAFGGGIDVHLTRRIIVRPADFEYQHWNFPPTGLTPWAFSVGAAYTVF